MTNSEHRRIWGRSLHVDHKNHRGRYKGKEYIPTKLQDNRLENLQTLCVQCHINKDTNGKYKRTKIRFNRDEAIRLYKSGIGTKLLSDKYKCNPITVKYWLKRWEVKMRKRLENNQEYKYQMSIISSKSGGRPKIGEAIRKYRLEKKMTQADFGKLYGYVGVSVCNWEMGTRKPPEKLVEEIRNRIKEWLG